jgi:hypothetical protein
MHEFWETLVSELGGPLLFPPGRSEGNESVRLKRKCRNFHRGIFVSLMLFQAQAWRFLKESPGCFELSYSGSGGNYRA